MKKAVLAIIAVAVIALAPTSGAQARKSNQGKHLKNNPPYDCSITSKPATPKWIDQSVKKDKLGNKKIKLIWEDSDRAHDVEIKYRKAGGSWKTKKAGDDGDQWFKNLKNGVKYEFKMRGYSNCGKSGWTKTYNFLP